MEKKCWLDKIKIATYNSYSTMPATLVRGKFAKSQYTLRICLQAKAGSLAGRKAARGIQ